MYKILLYFLLLPLLGISQVKIGQDIIGSGVDYLGSHLAISGDGSTIVCATDFLPNQKYLKVYRYDNGAWIQVGQEFNDNLYDIALADDGRTMALSSHDSSYKFFRSGVARIYHLDSTGNWSQKGQDIEGFVEHDFNGLSISISSDGDTFAIATRGDKVQSSGYVRIFKFENGEWVQKGNTIYGKANEQYFGNNISLSGAGDKIVIGSTYINSKGKVNVFKYQLNSWIQVGQDILGNDKEGLGSAVKFSADGSTIAAYVAHNRTTRVYRENSNVWKQIGQDIPSDTNFSVTTGYVVKHIGLSSDGTTIVTAHPHYNATIQVYKNLANKWLRLGEEIQGDGRADMYGRTVALSNDGNRLVIGAPRYMDGWGKVQVFDLSTASSNNFVLENFNIYPNPAKDKVNVSLENNLEFKSAILYNNLGQIVKTSNQPTFDVSAFAPGIYFIEIKTDKGKATKKLIVK